MKKSNVVSNLDKDLIELAKKEIKKQLETNDPEYDGSSLILREDVHGVISR